MGQCGHGSDCSIIAERCPCADGIHFGLWLPAVLFLFTLPAIAGEQVVLTNGFRLYADRHEVTSGMVRLYTGTSVD